MVPYLHSGRVAPDVESGHLCHTKTKIGVWKERLWSTLESSSTQCSKMARTIATHCIPNVNKTMVAALVGASTLLTGLCILVFGGESVDSEAAKWVAVSGASLLGSSLILICLKECHRINQEATG